MTPEAKFLTEIMLMIFRVNGRLLEGGDRLGTPLNITSARWQVLGAIALSETQVTVPQIAETMGITRQGAQKQINTLEKDGFVEKQINPRHRRSPFYDLTKLGQESYRRISELHTVWANSLSRNLDSTALENTLSTLQLVDENLIENALQEESHERRKR